VSLRPVRWDIRSRNIHAENLEHRHLHVVELVGDRRQHGHETGDGILRHILHDLDDVAGYGSRLLQPFGGPLLGRLDGRLDSVDGARVGDQGVRGTVECSTGPAECVGRDADLGAECRGGVGVPSHLFGPRLDPRRVRAHVITLRAKQRRVRPHNSHVTVHLRPQAVAGAARAVLPRRKVPLIRPLRARMLSSG
jgi:hypothetical protein